MRWIALSIIFVACGDPAPTVRPDPPAEPDPAPHDPPPVHEPSPEQTAPIAAPSSGCTFSAPVRVWEGDGWASIVAHDGFVIAGTVGDGDGERVFAVRLSRDGALQTIAEERLDPPLPPDHRRAGPALASTGTRVALALVFGDRHLRVSELSERGFVWRSAGEGASERFSPALVHDGDAWLVAWTDERESPSRIRAVRVGAEEPREIRPMGGSATAPAFVSGASPPTLVFFDAREGMSVAHRVRLDAASAPEVAQPINLIAAPPELAAARIGEHDWLGYTAIGMGATTAVGLVRAGGRAAPSALVRGTGYGTLHVHAASLGADRAVFVADAPQAASPESPRELRVSIVEADRDSEGGAGEPAIVRGPSGAASRGRIAHAGDGLVAVSFSDRDGVYAALGRCAR